MPPPSSSSSSSPPMRPENPPRIKPLTPPFSNPRAKKTASTSPPFSSLSLLLNAHQQETLPLNRRGRNRNRKHPLARSLACMLCFALLCFAKQSFTQQEKHMTSGKIQRGDGGKQNDLKRLLCIAQDQDQNQKPSLID